MCIRDRFIIQIVRLKCHVNRFCGQCHFLKKSVSKFRLQKMQFGGVFLTQKEGIARKSLVITDHHIAGSQLSDEIGILSLPGQFDSLADAAYADFG